MENAEKAKYYLDSLTASYTDEEVSDKRKHFFKIFSIFKELISEAIAEEKQYFINDFAKIVFISDKFSIDEELSHNLKSIRYFSSKLRRSKKIPCSQNELNLLAKSTLQLSEIMFGSIDEPFADKIKSIHINKIPYEKTYEGNEYYSFTYVIYKSKGIYKNEKGFESPYIICETDEGELIKVVLNEFWKQTAQTVFENCSVNLFDLKILDSENNVFRTSSKSVIVIEPEYLFDATEISECFTNNGVVWQSFFVRMYANKQLTTKLLSGNLINYIFDELITDNTLTYDELYEKATVSKPLSLFALSIQDPDGVKSEMSRLAEHFINLKEYLKLLDVDKYYIEPSFISGDYGLQGRLDLMLDTGEEESRKDVIELKSGRAPAPNYSIKGNDSQTIPIGMWYNHFAQISCYNLLLDSAYKNRKGVSSILYSSTKEKPLRNAPNYYNIKAEIIKVRNLLVHIIYRLANNDFVMYEKLNPWKLGNITSYLKTDLNNIFKHYTDASEIEREYFLKFSAFIQREILFDKFSSSNNINGFSALWRQSIEEKKENFSIISDLILDNEKSDLEDFHLFFNRNDNSISSSSFRKGDIVILYPVSEDFSNPLQGQIIKCVIKEINDENILLSLRNKLFQSDIIRQEYLFWAIEPDKNDSNNKKLFSNLFDFLKAPKHKKDILLGLKQPEINDEIEVNNSELSGNKLEIFTKAVKAKYYFLIQGPPGTGKTSFMLKNLVKHLIENTSEDILLLAYTNRAVDEICEVLNKLGVDFLRLGRRESTVHQDNIIVSMVENSDIRDAFMRIRKLRIIVSTVYSAITNFEIFTLKKFGTCIIDEASQLLEPHIIGILNQVNKFILIGDEKQLPAIVTQSEQFTASNSELLESIELKSLNISLFERLLRVCKNNNWNDSFGILTNQARMHREIQEFPNKNFYNGKLELLESDSWQTKELNILNIKPLNAFEQKLKSNRLIFINSVQEYNSKFNISEQKLVKKIIDTYYSNLSSDFNEDTLGVISPFRAQCSALYNMLEPEQRHIISIDTVERFQGSERKIIIFSFALNYPVLLANVSSVIEIDGQQIDRKLNVALTRAKEQLIIIGREEILSVNPIYKELIEHIKENGAYLDFSEIIELISLEGE